jgi:hypothetical protein
LVLPRRQAPALACTVPGYGWLPTSICSMPAVLRHDA